jgi:hypothetical protein
MIRRVARFPNDLYPQLGIEGNRPKSIEVKGQPRPPVKVIFP